jgi:hypothetical protein
MNERTRCGDGGDMSEQLKGTGSFLGRGPNEGARGVSEAFVASEALGEGALAEEVGYRGIPCETRGGKREEMRVKAREERRQVGGLNVK